jgi:hypothetical protein
MRHHENIAIYAAALSAFFAGIESKAEATDAQALEHARKACALARQYVTSQGQRTRAAMTLEAGALAALSQALQTPMAKPLARLALAVTRYNGRDYRGLYAALGLPFPG